MRRQVEHHVHLLLVVVPHQPVGEIRELGGGGWQHNLLGQLRRRGIVQAVGHQRLDHAQPPHGPQLEADGRGGVRLLGLSRQQIELAVEEQQRAEIDELAGIRLREIDVGLRPAVEKLAGDVDPGSRAGGHEHLAVNAGAAYPVGLHQVREIELFAQKRRGAVAEVLVAGEDLLIVLECGAALLERDVKSLQLQAHAAAEVVGLVAQTVRDRVLVGRR